MVAIETNRAKAVAMKAEVRRTKARLMDEIQKLQKLAQKKVLFFFSYLLHFVLKCMYNWIVFFFVSFSCLSCKYRLICFDVSKFQNVHR